MSSQEFQLTATPIQADLPFVPMDNRYKLCSVLLSEIKPANINADKTPDICRKHLLLLKHYSPS
jgi:hypothetical protein